MPLSRTRIAKPGALPGPAPESGPGLCIFEVICQNPVMLLPFRSAVDGREVFVSQHRCTSPLGRRGSMEAELIPKLPPTEPHGRVFQFASGQNSARKRQVWTCFLGEVDFHNVVSTKPKGTHVSFSRHHAKGVLRPKENAST